MPSSGLNPAADRKRRLLRRLRLLMVSAILAILFGIMGAMTQNVVAQLNTLRSAASDNLQWTLSQVDSEFLRFRHALDTAHALNVSVPLTANIMETLQALKNDDMGGSDHSAIVRHYEKLAKTEVRK